MFELLNGHLDHMIDSYKVIDCRYPYEFTGGHIKVGMGFPRVFFPQLHYKIYVS